MLGLGMLERRLEFVLREGSRSDGYERHVDDVERSGCDEGFVVRVLVRSYMKACRYVARTLLCM